MKTIRYIEIKKILEVNSIEVKSNISDNESFSSIKTLSNSKSNDLSFFSNLKYLNDLKKNKAKACLIEDKFLEYLPKDCEPIIVKDPYLALALISNIFNEEQVNSNGIISLEHSGFLYFIKGSFSNDLPVK